VFLQSVEEIALSLLPLFDDPKNGEFYKRAFVATTEPERVVSFRVPWEDDNGTLHFNRGWRIEFSRYVRHFVCACVSGIHQGALCAKKKEKEI
jgi:glutamate dehydrogenase (NADP+)